MTNEITENKNTDTVAQAVTALLATAKGDAKAEAEIVKLRGEG